VICEALGVAPERTRNLSARVRMSSGLPSAPQPAIVLAGQEARSRPTGLRTSRGGSVRDVPQYVPQPSRKIIGGTAARR
jgi:hypothetical protein